MDLASIDKFMLRALHYVEGERETVHVKKLKSLYSPSKLKINHILTTTSKFMRCLNDLVQEEALVDDDTEFNVKSDYASNDQIQSFVHQMMEFVSQFNSDVPVNSKINITQSPEALIGEWNKSITKVDIVNILKTYNSSLENLAKKDCGVPVVNQCSDILWRWYHSRIIKKYDHAPTFNYDIYRIKNILYYLVVVFGYYFERGDLDSFITSFKTWESELSVSPKSHTWIAPWEVFQVERDMEKSYSNLSSVVIWDILLDNGLLLLCESSPHNDVYPRKDGVWKIIETVDTDTLDRYENYRHDPKILMDLNLVTGGSIDEVHTDN